LTSRRAENGCTTSVAWYPTVCDGEWAQRPAGGFGSPREKRQRRGNLGRSVSVVGTAAHHATSAVGPRPPNRHRVPPVMRQGRSTTNGFPTPAPMLGPRENCIGVVCFNRRALTGTGVPTTRRLCRLSGSSMGAKIGGGIRKEARSANLRACRFPTANSRKPKQ